MVECLRTDNGRDALSSKTAPHTGRRVQVVWMSVVWAG
jgi:hypothetical protein